MRPRTLLPALLAAFAFAAPAFAQPQGYWAVAEAPDGIKLGIIFPDYSPNDFAGLGFVCSPGDETAQGWSVVGKGLKGGAKTPVVIEAGGAPARYAAKAERSEIDDSVRAAFVTTLADPIFDDLAAAQALKVGVGKSASQLPTRGAAKAVNEFRVKCRVAGE